MDSLGSEAIRFLGFFALLASSETTLSPEALTLCDYHLAAAVPNPWPNSRWLGDVSHQKNSGGSMMSPLAGIVMRRVSSIVYLSGQSGSADAARRPLGQATDSMRGM